MATNFLIGLREGLEAALIVGILVAYLIRSGRTHLLPSVWAGAGVAAGISLAVGVALTLGHRQLPDRAAEILEGVIGIAAAVVLTWVIFWMARTARFLKERLETALGEAAGLGKGAVFALALFAVGREGLEVVLFLLAGVTAAGSTVAPLLGATLGIATAVALGWAVYRGAVRIDLGTFFTVTGYFLIVLAAGVFAHGFHELQEAGVVRGFDAIVYDVSAQVPTSSWHGTLLKGIFGFSAAPTVLEVVAWLSYLAVALTLFTRIVRSDQPRPTQDSPTKRDAGERVSV